ncbi:MAG: patatin-like phospholipase family protein [Hyphomicrobiaceae bacterium]
MNHATPKIGLVLSSGAARGWAHIGVLRALAAHQIHPDVICGCSFGALVAASHVTGHLDSLEALARSLTPPRVLRYFDISFRGGGLIEGRWIIDFFRENVDDTAIENTTIVYGAVATDLASGRETWLTSGSIIDAVRASIAIPGLLTPIQIRGRWHIDGALVNPLPVSLCRALGADVIIGVNLNGDLTSRPELARSWSPALTEPAISSAAGASSWLQWMGYSKSVDGDENPTSSTAAKRPGYLEVVSQTFFLVQDFVSRVRLAADPVDVLIAPKVTDIGWLEFHRASEAIEAGEAAARDLLPALKTAIGRPAEDS